MLTGEKATVKPQVGKAEPHCLTCAVLGKLAEDPDRWFKSTIAWKINAIEGDVMEVLRYLTSKRVIVKHSSRSAWQALPIPVLSCDFETTPESVVNGGSSAAPRPR